MDKIKRKILVKGLKEKKSLLIILQYLYKNCNLIN